MNQETPPSHPPAAANSRMWMVLGLVSVALLGLSLFAFADGEVIPGLGILAVGVVFLLAAVAAWTPRGRASLASLRDYRSSFDLSPIGDSGGDGGSGGGGD